MLDDGLSIGELWDVLAFVAICCKKTEFDMKLTNAQLRKLCVLVIQLQDSRATLLKPKNIHYFLRQCNTIRQSGDSAFTRTNRPIFTFSWSCLE